MVAATIRTIFAQPTAQATREQLRNVADTLRDRYPAVSDLLLEAETDVTAYAAFPTPHWKKIWSRSREGLRSTRAAKSRSHTVPTTSRAVSA